MLLAGLIICSGALAAGGTVGNLNWELENGTLTISGTGDMESVNSGAWHAYAGLIENIVICDGVTSIGEQAFSGCSSLESVSIPEGVTCIEEYAFAGCDKLESVTIPTSVTSIEGGAFIACYRLKSISIPSGVTSIAHSAFDGYNQTIYAEIGSGAAKALGKAGYLQDGHV